MLAMIIVRLKYGPFKVDHGESMTILIPTNLLRLFLNKSSAVTCR